MIYLSHNLISSLNIYINLFFVNNRMPCIHLIIYWLYYMPLYYMPALLYADFSLVGSKRPERAEAPSPGHRPGY